MKKILSLFIIVTILITMLSCSSDDVNSSEKTSKYRIELTLENYEIYLKVFHYLNDGENKKNIGGVTHYKDMNYVARTEGTSSNFNYYDINVKIKVSGSLACYSQGLTFRQLPDLNVEDTLTITSTDISGLSSSVSGKVTLTTEDNYIFADSSSLHDIKFEIISVSGYVVPV